ncbi:HD domain-containing phosphohydrolase [Pseudomonadota bacterium]
MSSVMNNILNAGILIVDDNQANVTLLEMMLSYAGYTQVQSTTDSREVKDIYHSNNIDLILLDIRMPYLDGFQVMEQLSDQIKDDYLPILVLTAQKDMETRVKSLESGAKDFVTKPFDRLEVLNRISNMLEVRLLYNERAEQNELLASKVRDRTQELADTRLEIIHRLGRAGEYRDNETGMHVVRMSKTSHCLALAMGLGETYADMILNASPMHDVGKIGVPDQILLKPGKLDPQEWETMKTHTTIGADIIGKHHSDLMQMARSIALTHHEKWDGSGYPNGLVGKEIPIEGRICAIADVFDALTAERPYKKAWPIQDAINYIRENANTHFDPQLTLKFDSVLPCILKITKDYAEEN